MSNSEPCHGCGTPTPLDLLDGAPSKTKTSREALIAAADHGANFDTLLCRKCYGPEWRPNQERGA